MKYLLRRTESAGTNLSTLKINLIKKKIKSAASSALWHDGKQMLRMSQIVLFCFGVFFSSSVALVVARRAHVTVCFGSGFVQACNFLFHKLLRLPSSQLKKNLQFFWFSFTLFLFDT